MMVMLDDPRSGRVILPEAVFCSVRICSQLILYTFSDPVGHSKVAPNRQIRHIEETVVERAI